MRKSSYQRLENNVKSTVFVRPPIMGPQKTKVIIPNVPGTQSECESLI